MEDGSWALRCSMIGLAMLRLAKARTMRDLICMFAGWRLRFGKDLY